MNGAPVLTPARALRLAGVLLGHEGTWTQGAWARRTLGDEVPACDQRARSWCAEGALYRICAGDIATWTAAAEALRDVIGRRDRSIKRWNDSGIRTRVEVTAALRKAAVTLERAAS
jgi:hypothetical protein